MIFLKNVVAFAKPEINYNMILRKITPPISLPALQVRCRHADRFVLQATTGAIYENCRSNCKLSNLCKTL